MPCELPTAHHVAQILADMVPGFSHLLSLLGVVIEGMTMQKSSCPTLTVPRALGCIQSKPKGNTYRRSRLCVFHRGVLPQERP